MLRDRAENGVQGSDAKGFVGGDGDPLMRRFIRLQHDVAAFLMNYSVAPLAAKRLDKILTAEAA